MATKALASQADVAMVRRRHGTPRRMENSDVIWLQSLSIRAPFQAYAPNACILGFLLSIV